MHYYRLHTNYNCSAYHNNILLFYLYPHHKNEMKFFTIVTFITNFLSHISLIIVALCYKF